MPTGSRPVADAGAMRNEQKRANGETLLFDSQDLDKSTPELREQMSKYIGQTWR